MTEFKKPLTLVLKCDDLDRPLTYLVNEASVQITLKPSDDFIELVSTAGFTQRGKFSWALPMKDNARAAARFLRTYGETFMPGTMSSSMEDDTDGARTLSTEEALHAWYITIPQPAFNDGSAFRTAMTRLAGFSFPKIVAEPKYVQDVTDYARIGYGRNTQQRRAVYLQKYSTLGGVQVELKNDLLWVRLFPTRALTERYASIYLPKLKNVRYSHNSYFPPRNIITHVAVLKSMYGDTVFDVHSEPVFDLLEKTKDVISVGYSPNQPATVLLCRGENVPIFRGVVSGYKANEEMKVPLKEVLRLQKKSDKIPFLIHPGLSDIVNMTNAKPYTGDARLKPYQQEAVGLHLSTEIGYLQTCSPGMGKGHPLTTNVLTPDGWKQVGDLEVGNAIFGSGGKPTTVTAIFPRGELDVFRVTFNDGSSVLVDGDHLWSVRNMKDKSAGYQTLSTAELTKSFRSSVGNSTWQIPLTAPISYAPQKLLPIRSYDLGIALGEASNAATGIGELYLRADVQDRIDLLQGLMDSIGRFDVDNSQLSWESKNKQLAEDTAELIESLGGTAVFNEREKKQEKVYHLIIILPNSITPFRLQRKLKGYVPRKSKPVRIMTSIVPAGREEVRCISVAAENSLYITEHHIVTHNTVIQLVAMRAKALKTENYRGLVVCEANLRTQWLEEAAIWFPEATVVIIRTQDDVNAVADGLAVEGPLLLITSYSHTLLGYEAREQRLEEAARLNSMTYAQKMKTLQETDIPELTIGSILLDSKWDEVCADEAVVIRNGTSKQSNFMWTIRKNSKMATALTATPINKSPDDLGRLVAWVRNDKNMFTGVPLSEQYDTGTAAGAKKLFQTFGPIIFRRDTSEIAKSLPKVNQDVMLLKPNTAEKALANAAENELKRCYFELVAAVDEAEKAAKENDMPQEEIQKVKDNLKAANGAWLGGTMLARMATSDAAALQNSTSIGAALLGSQGLIDAAMKTEPTKRVKFIEDAQKRTLKGQQLLVFTSFSTVADLLVKALQENGINAKAYTGKNGTARDRARIEFQEGNLDVLVCTQAAERGLTLHKAAAIYHYDLPWTLDKIIQRTGRSIRIGSENETVDIVFMIMEGTVEQRMANHIVELGMSASLVMDNSRGIDLKTTETAMAMSGLMTAMAKTSDNKNMVAFGKLLLGV